MKRLHDSSDVPEARLGILLKTYTSSKKKTRLHSTFPRRNGYSRLRQQMSRRKESLWWISGASMHIVSKKDLNSAELATMRTSRGPMTVMTATGEVRGNKEATVYVKQLYLFVKVMLLEETPAVLSLWKLCEDHGFSYHRTSGQNHISPKMGRKLIAIYPTVYNLWFLESQRVLPLLRIHLPLHHLHQRIPCFNVNR